MTLTDTQRLAIVYTAELFIGNAPTIDYPADPLTIRPHKYRSKEWLEGYWAKGHHSEWDCSIAAQQVFYVTDLGIKDPSGHNYDGFGTTQDWLNNLKHYTNPGQAHPGALVVFGADLPVRHQHGCIVIQRNGQNPVLFSHGSNVGPLGITLEDEQRAHTGKTVFLDVSPLGT